MTRKSLSVTLLATTLLLGACGKKEISVSVAEPSPKQRTGVSEETKPEEVKEPEVTEAPTEPEETGPVELTLDNYFETDPADSEWGRSDEAADIIGLVDLDYIRSAMEGTFEVDSVEDLASLTYYVNTYPLPRIVESGSGDKKFYCYVNINSDLDLSAYKWPTIGMKGKDHERAFAGMLIGNGHTISGIDPETGFFEDIFFSTVCGLTIDAGVVSEDVTGIFAEEIDDVRFFDCHLIDTLQEGDSNPNPYVQFQMYDTGQGNRYIDCSVEITWGEEEVWQEELNLNDDYPEGARNSILDFFDPEGDGTYTYEKDFFDEWL